MMTVTEKAAYLKGLAEGLSLDPDKNETKLINAMIDLGEREIALENVIGFRPPSNQIPSAVQSDSVRHPIRFRSLRTDF